MELLHLIKTELSLDLKQLVGYRVSFFSDIAIFCMVVFSTLILGLDDAFAVTLGTDPFTGKMMVLIGFIFWQISTTALGWSSSNIQGQSLSGILELKMQSKFPVELMLFIEMLTYLLVGFLSFTVIFTILIIALGKSFYQILYIPLSYLIAFPGVVGMYGLGLFFGGISLREKNIGTLVYIIQALMAFVSDFSGIRSRFFNIIPFNAGIKIMRNLYLSKPIEPTWINDYFLINLFWLALGLVLFKLFLAKERKCGAFDTY